MCSDSLFPRSELRCASVFVQEAPHASHRRTMHFDVATVLGFLGGIFYLASHYQKDMVSLRVLALASNTLFLIFGILHVHFDVTELIGMPEVILNAILLPINIKRLNEILRLTKQIEQATVASPVSE